MLLFVILIQKIYQTLHTNLKFGSMLRVTRKILRPDCDKDKNMILYISYMCELAVAPMELRAAFRSISFANY